jgi:hypothetical protein
MFKNHTCINSQGYCNIPTILQDVNMILSRNASMYTLLQCPLWYVIFMFIIYQSLLYWCFTVNVNNTVKLNVPAVITPHPETIQVMLNLLAQNRSLTVLQYETLLRYLTQRRDQQAKLELGDTAIAPPLPLAKGCFIFSL